MYKKICFEADFKENSAPTGIDDVTCIRHDNKQDYYQVKYTPSTEKNFLTWKWLLEIKGKTDRSKSLIQKLSNAINETDPSLRGEVVLITNKLPDRVMDECIKNQRIDFELIPDDIKDDILVQIGSESLAKALFEILIIKSGEKNYHNLKNDLLNSLSKVSDETGVYRLLNKAKEWAIFKDMPSIGGWITLDDVHSVLSNFRPKPIPQDFLIPSDYIPPDQDFHTNFLSQILNKCKNEYVVTGPPGRGKSTYISYLLHELELQEIPSIRHHYFLSLNDRTNDRFNQKVVEDGLIDQIRTHHNLAIKHIDSHKNLHDHLVACGDYYLKHDKPFILVIDGLDHVWRDNNKDSTPLNYFFNSLLPIHKNVVLIIGSQPIMADLVPAKLLLACPLADWEILPKMTPDVLSKYMGKLVESKRLKLQFEHNKEEEFSKASLIIHNITQGHPLHLIYVTEYLIANDISLSEWNLSKLPKCNGDTITDYYETLWNSLDYKQRDILHLCCEYPFYWGKSAFEQVLKFDNSEVSLIKGVLHLLHDSMAGVRPFHESLKVYVSQLDEHQDRISFLLPDICSWLNSDAPMHIKDIWYGISLAKLGDSSYLRNNISRDWIIEKLSTGYTIESLAQLLDAAEESSFELNEFNEAHHFRSLSIRLLNGIDFETNEDNELKILSIYYSDSELIKELISSSDSLRTDDLCILAIALWKRGLIEESNRIGTLALNRHRAEYKLSSKSNNDRSSEDSLLVSMLALTTPYNDRANIVLKWPSVFKKLFVRCLTEKSEISDLINLHELTSSSKFKGLIEVNSIYLSIINDFDINEWDEFENFKHSSISTAYRLIRRIESDEYNVNVYISNASDSSPLKITETYQEYFFQCLNLLLSAKGDVSFIPVDSDGSRNTSDDIDRSPLFEKIQTLAHFTVESLFINKKISFDEFLRFNDEFDIENSREHYLNQEHKKVTNSLISIAINLHMVSCNELISSNDIGYFLEQDCFNKLKFVKFFSRLKANLFTEEAIIKLFDGIDNQVSNRVMEAYEFSDLYCQMSSCLIRYKLDEKGKEYLIKAWQFVTGYGHRKDLGLLTLGSSIEYLADYLPEDSVKLIKLISPQIHNISEFTDGKETGYPLAVFNQILAKHEPESLMVKYSNEIMSSDWHKAENSFDALIKYSTLDFPVFKNIFATGISSEHISYLQERAFNGHSESEKLLEISFHHNGISTDNYSRSNDKKEVKVSNWRNIDFKAYEPSQFEDLLLLLKDSYDSSTELFEWFDYWVENGKKSDLHNLVLPILLSSDKSDVCSLLDRQFDVSRKLKGSRGTFKIIVNAHIKMNGWTRWGESEEVSYERLKKVAKYYPKRAMEFIKLTTKGDKYSRTDSNGLILPYERLVYFYLLLGMTKEALDLTSTFVKVFIDETKQLNLPSPEWNFSPILKSTSYEIDVLISRLNIPVPSIKWWTTNEIVKLLISGEHSCEIEKNLKNLLLSKNLESEVIELLLIFWIAKQKGYKSKQPLGKLIRARSLLSDMIISDIDSTDIFGDYADSSNPFELLKETKGHFKSAMGVELPLTYKTTLEKLQVQCGFPLIELFESEWEKSYVNSPYKYQDYQYFIRTASQDNTGQFYTQTSHRGRSAYLRVIQIVLDYFSLPLKLARQYATLALPFDPSFMDMNPTRPNWIEKKSKSIEFNEDSISSFVLKVISNLANNNKASLLGALSIPVYIDENNLIDITVLRVGEDACVDTFSKHIGNFSNHRFGEGLDKQSQILQNVKMNSSNRPLFATCYPLLRYGAWHTEIESRGLYAPVNFKDNKSYIMSSKLNGLQFEDDGTIFAESGYWNCDWKPNNIVVSKAKCATYTLILKDKMKNWLPDDICNSTKLFCNAVLVSRKEKYNKHETSEISFVIPENT